jgi:hypothetical protein
MTIQLDRLISCMEYLEANAQKYEQQQSIDSLIYDVGILIKSLAFCNYQMVAAKRLLLDAKARAYQLIVNGKNPIASSPMLAKDYVNSICAEEQMQYDLAERASRTVSRTIEALQTCISALKVEYQATTYAGRLNAIT